MRFTADQSVFWQAALLLLFETLKYTEASVLKVVLLELTELDGDFTLLRSS